MPARCCNTQLCLRCDSSSANETNYIYDRFERLSKRIFPDLSFEQNSIYDDNGHVLTFVTRAGDEIVSTFDVLNRLETKRPGSLALQTMTYDLAGRLLNINTPTDSDDPTSGDYGYDYDTAGRLIEQSMPDGKTVGYELDDNANRTKLIYPDGYYTEYVYDELNRLIDIKLDGSELAAVHFDYDALSRRTLVSYENGSTCSYSWELNNDLATLRHEFDEETVNYAFSYNKVHQEIGLSVSNKKYVWTPSVSKSEVYSTANNLNQYPAVGAIDYSYSDNGNLTGGPFSATFDALDRMTQVIVDETTNDYIYDPFSRQARKTSNTVETNYLYDGQQMIGEYNDDNELVNRYIVGNRIDSIFIKIESVTKSYLHHDRLGSAIARSNGSGSLLNRYKYGTFGETPSLTGIAFGYTGQRYDAEVDLYNFKARIYSPTLGRFLQSDPIGFASGNLNFYTYAKNDSINSIDPSGMVDLVTMGVNAFVQNIAIPLSNAIYKSSLPVANFISGYREPGVYLYSPWWALHTGIEIVQPDRQIWRIDGGYSKQFSGDLTISVRNDRGQANLPNWVDLWPQTTDPKIGDALIQEGNKLNYQITTYPMEYAPIPGIWGPESASTSNQVPPYLFGQVGLKYPLRLAPGNWKQLRPRCK